MVCKIKPGFSQYDLGVNYYGHTQLNLSTASNAYSSTEGLLSVFILGIIIANDVNCNKGLRIPICMLGRRSRSNIKIRPIAPNGIPLSFSFCRRSSYLAHCFRLVCKFQQRFQFTNMTISKRSMSHKLKQVYNFKLKFSL